MSNRLYHVRTACVLQNNSNFYCLSLPKWNPTQEIVCCHIKLELFSSVTWARKVSGPSLLSFSILPPAPPVCNSFRVCALFYVFFL